MEFRNVWFRSNKDSWVRSIRAYEDTGTLTVDEDCLTFTGKRQRLSISNVRSVSRNTFETNFINKWICVEYEADSEMRSAYFVDGGLLGWSGILGGNKRMFEALQHHFQQAPQ